MKSRTAQTVKLKKEKAQTAMEYLMTYGWAILVIMVVVAALLYLGILRPNAMSVNQCTFPAGFSCTGSKLYTNGFLYLKIGQGTGRTIIVNGATCTENPNYVPGGVVYCGCQVVRVPTATEAVVSSQNFNIHCTDEKGNPITGKVGDVYNGWIYVNYTEEDTGVYRLAIGRITMKYELPGP